MNVKLGEISSLIREASVAERDRIMKHFRKLDEVISRVADNDAIGELRAACLEFKACAASGEEAED